MSLRITQRTNSNVAFTLGIIAILLFLFLIWGVFGLDISNYFTAIIGLLIGLISIIGIVYSFKSLQEPTGIRSVFGFILNGVMAILFVITFVGFLLS
ncbi:hypothetical protein FVB9288_02437 [Flavobacterium sp. CECT 9288]|uniref:hypothetical protein n=1 Tax=Flavobacterium sp. CECT 9288 TaxID=2845819 RepID=UPI001E510D1E|nr:hypothetical protein [Flavobacterium sp. CECT 9288]CAH0336724.1 hypothetical protein FVB9288_02437 [Flavobacterium sp. CECT 9288]